MTDSLSSSPVVGWREQAQMLGRSYQGDRVEPQAGRLAGYLLTALAELDAVEQDRDALKARIAAALNIDSAAFLAAYEGQSVTAYRIGYNVCFDAFRAALSVAVPEEGAD